jgi:hypothetical protein
MKLESQLQNPPPHSQWADKIQEGAQSFAFPHFLISLAINHPVPGARVFDSEESRKPGNETGKPIAKTPRIRNKSQKTESREY